MDVGIPIYLNVKVRNPDVGIMAYYHLQAVISSVYPTHALYAVANCCVGA